MASLEPLKAPSEVQIKDQEAQKKIILVFDFQPRKKKVNILIQNSSSMIYFLSINECLLHVSQDKALIHIAGIPQKLKRSKRWQERILLILP